MSITMIFMVACVVVVALYDVWVIATRGKFESISAYIIRGSKKMPLLVLLAGIVLGHLFWSMDSFDYLTKEEIIKRCKVYKEQ